jgi:cell pole-organizing protein PopZ
MSQAAKAQEPSMEEILASIRRIIADDDAGKPAEKPSEAPVTPTLGASPSGAENGVGPMNQDDIDAMLAGFDVLTTADDAAGFSAALEPRSGSERPAEAEPAHSADILELTSAMEARPAAAFRKIEPGPDVYFGEKQSAPEPSAAAASAAPGMPKLTAVGASDPTAGPMLLSDHATVAATSAFSSLAHTVLMQNARTLDDLVREMLRPMLKSWLDDNLPTIVERLVRAEIERVSRGRG